MTARSATRLAGFFLGGIFLLCRVTAAEVAFTPSAANAFPAPGAAGVCRDTPLRLTFASSVSLGPSGKITIHDAANDAAVETIDVGAPTGTQAIGGLPGFKYLSVIAADSTLSIFPRHGALDYLKTYYVTIDAGALKVGEDAVAAIAGARAWRFTTKAPLPMHQASRLVIAADGTGDFCTVQGALDFLPDGNTTPVTLFLRKGVYAEIIFFTNKHAITLLGEGRKASIIAAANNANFNPDFGGNPFGGASPDPSAASVTTGPIYRRGLFTAHRANDLTLANLTLRNTTRLGGSQAEAIILNGTTGAHAILRDVDLYSFQDTLQINGQAYLTNCHIEGDVDFMWGIGPCFFENCTLRSSRSGAYYTQIRNPPANHGFVYAHCAFEGTAGVTGNFLSRIGPARFPASEVVLVDCTLTDAVGPVAWQWQGTGDISKIHFWEFNSHDAAGKPVDVSKRLAGSRQLTQPADAATIADYSNPSFVLGHGWQPRAAVNP